MSKNAPVYIGNRQLLDSSAIADLSATLLTQMISAFTGSSSGIISEYGYTPLNQNGQIDSKYVNLTVSDTNTPIVTHANKLNFIGDYISVLSGKTEGEAIISFTFPKENPEYSILKNTSFQTIFDGVEMILPANFTGSDKLYDNNFWSAGEKHIGINDYIKSTDTSLNAKDKYTFFTLKSKIPLYVPNNNTYLQIEIKTANTVIIAQTIDINVNMLGTQSINDKDNILVLNYSQDSIKEYDVFYAICIAIDLNLTKLIGKLSNLSVKGGQFQIHVKHFQRVQSNIQQQAEAVKQLGMFFSEKYYLNCGDYPEIVATDITSANILDKRSVYSSGIQYVTGGTLVIDLPSVKNLFRNASVEEKLVLQTNFTNPQQLILKTKDFAFKYAESDSYNSIYSVGIPKLNLVIPNNINIDVLSGTGIAFNAYGKSAQIPFTYDIKNNLNCIINSKLYQQINSGMTSNGTNEYFVNEKYRLTSEGGIWNSNAVLPIDELAVYLGTGLGRTNKLGIQSYYRYFETSVNTPKFGGTFVLQGITKAQFQSPGFRMDIKVGKNSNQWYSLQKWYDNNIINEIKQVRYLLEQLNDNNTTIFDESIISGSFAENSAKAQLSQSLTNKLAVLQAKSNQIGIKTDIYEKQNKLYVSFILFGDDNYNLILTDNSTNQNEYEIAAKPYAENGGIYLRIIMNENITPTISYIGLKNTTTMEEW